MKLERQIAFWVAFFIALIAFVWLFSSVLLPFVAAFVLAYLLDPVADRLEKWGLSRLGASLVILAVCGAILVVGIIILAPILAHQFQSFSENLPNYIRRLQALATDKDSALMVRVKPLLVWLGVGQEGAGSEGSQVTDLVGQAANWVGTFFKSLWQGSQALLGLLSLLVVTPVVAFYILLDWDSMLKSVDSWLPLRHRDSIRQIARDIDKALAGFVRGQSFVCLFLALWYGIGFSLTGLNFGLLIGLTAGFLSFIPYVGSLLGLVVSVTVALVTGEGWGLLGAVLAVQISGQFLEGNILTPRLVGNAVGVHPVWLMFALIAFGSLLGFTGLILAVPLAAAIGVLCRFALGQYLTSPLYSGGSITHPGTMRISDSGPPKGDL